MRLQSPELNCDGREINHFLELVNKLKMLNNVKNKESILKLLYLLSGTAKSTNNYSVPIIIESPNPLPTPSSFSVYITSIYRIRKVNFQLKFKIVFFCIYYFN